MGRKKRQIQIGALYGHLTVLEEYKENIVTSTKPNGSSVYFCKCKCDCGKEVTVRTLHLLNHHTTSCGCQSSKNFIGEFNKKSNKYIFEKDRIIIIDNSGHSFQISPQDYNKVSLFYWFGRYKKKGKGLYAYTESNGKTIPLHRFIMGAKEKQIVDHINRNTTDNRRENLRFATTADNTHNRINFNYTYDKARKKYQVFIKTSVHCFRKRVNTEEEAHRLAYLKRREFYKEFAWDWHLTEEESWEVLHNEFNK